ncbi:unnamed protein product [Adineta steineri]|uniref:Uncharacterized protein n=1 Tax=Adineta steineri TaxID=433720 RepID=A0A820DU82_9BILA|nr:unnamed protein product [Adineta steineri]CAF4237994.1 unnamed protein product [Adineta steineri]
MYCVPVTTNYWRTPVSYVPTYPTLSSQILLDNTNARLSYDLTKAQNELSNLREELTDLRLEREICPICTSVLPLNTYYEDCSICYRRALIRERELLYSRTLSPVHYCNICDDYVVDDVHTPSPSSASFNKKTTTKKNHIHETDKLSEYLTRQLDLHRLRHRYIREQRPIWIPTAYKQDYPYRRWLTRSARLSEP